MLCHVSTAIDDLESADRRMSLGTPPSDVQSHHGFPSRSRDGRFKTRHISKRHNVMCDSSINNVVYHVYDTIMLPATSTKRS